MAAQGVSSIDSLRRLATEMISVPYAVSVPGVVAAVIVPLA
jgi:hypothetical protein